MAATDKEQRLAEEAAAVAKAEAEKTTSLDPVFPYRIEPFDPDFFDVTS